MSLLVVYATILSTIKYTKAFLTDKMRSIWRLALNSYDNFIIVIVALKCKGIRGFELIDIKKTSLYNKFICLKSYGGSYERNQL